MGRGAQVHPGSPRRFAITIPATELTLARLLEPLGAFSDTTCLMGRKQCQDDEPCAAHWH